MLDEDRDYNSQTPNAQPPETQPQWRQDFPIDIPQDNYIARREFTKFLVLTSGAFAFGQCWILWENWRREQGGEAKREKVASLDQIPVGGSLVFHYPNEHEPCLLLRPDETTLVAYSQKCTHLSCPVLPEMDTGRLMCPCHHGYFSIEDGRPLAGPPRRPLPEIEIEVEGNDIYAAGVTLRTV